MPDQKVVQASSAPSGKITLINWFGYLKMSLDYRIEVVRHFLYPKKVPVPHLMKRRVIRQFAKRHNIRCFVETGTYCGDMIASMLKCFDELHSIELSHRYYQKALQRFANKPSVHLYHGDSAMVLPRVLQSCTVPTLFWLDAHFSGGDTARGDSDTPITQEIAIIMNHGIPDHVVLIDDARCFVGRNGYPTTEALKELVMRLRPDCEFSIRQDIIRIHPKVNLSR